MFLPSREFLESKGIIHSIVLAVMMFPVQHFKKSNEELLSKLIPIAAAHRIACSHWPFDLVWRFTVWTHGALRYFVRSFGRAVDLDA